MIKMLVLFDVIYLGDFGVVLGLELFLSLGIGVWGYEDIGGNLVQWREVVKGILG